MRTLIELVIVLGLCWWAFFLGGLSEQVSITALEQTDLCYDTPKYEAWVSSKNGTLRCFMEQRSYPHRVKAAHIELGETK